MTTPLVSCKEKLWAKRPAEIAILKNVSRIFFIFVMVLLLFAFAAKLSKS
jgi:hypothetical protein